MASYCKKPVIIQATQWFKPGDHAAVSTWDKGGQMWVNGQNYIETLEGRMLVREGDWIITGVKGEHYACKPDVFEATYEAVE